jgi:hypothetical protein
VRFRLFLIAALLLALAHRLPAPIQEASESQTPGPRQSEKSKPKSDKPKTQTKSEPQRQTQKNSSASSLAGTWTGSFGTAASDGSSGTRIFVITISPDGKTAWTKWMLASGNWSANFQTACQGAGNLLSWTFPSRSTEVTVTNSFNLQSLGNRSATVRYHQLITAGSLAGATIDGNGILAKQ